MSVVTRNIMAVVALAWLALGLIVSDPIAIAISQVWYVGSVLMGRAT